MSEHHHSIWGSGDFPKLASTMLIVGEYLCESVSLRAGRKVLDVGTGSGNTALAAARRYCDVTGLDIVPALIETARERAATERLPLNFTVGDAEALPFRAASFDAVLSTFGGVYASESRLNEMLRVLRSGGSIGTVHWSRGCSMQIVMATAHQGAGARFGRKRPLREVKEYLSALFRERVVSVRVARRSFVFRYRSSQDWVDFLQSSFGPVIKAFETLDTTARQERARDLVGVVRRLNCSGDDTLVMPSEYIEVVAVKR
jgi:ubiquinone/menaquinone biosynthesis C-methylase UbiE